MHINPGLACLWHSTDSLQIGLDPRTGVRLERFTTKELDLVSALSVPRSEIEFYHLAEGLGVQRRRAHEIKALLEKAGVLADDTAYGLNVQAHWRIHRRLPASRKARVFIGRLDHLGLAITLGLAEAGVGIFECADDELVGPGDHPLLQRTGFGLPRYRVLATLLRARNQDVRMMKPARRDSTLEHQASYGSGSARLSDSTPEFHLVPRRFSILTGYNAVDPFTSRYHVAQGDAILHAHVEEVDLVVGPLTIGGDTSCGGCAYLHRLDADPAWERLGPQALRGAPITPESHTLALASSLAVREILAYLEGQTPSVFNSVWRIPPVGELPYLEPLPPHPDCGCGALSPDEIPHREFPPRSA